MAPATGRPSRSSTRPVIGTSSLTSRSVKSLVFFSPSQTQSGPWSLATTTSFAPRRTTAATRDAEAAVVVGRGQALQDFFLDAPGCDEQPGAREGLAVGSEHPAADLDVLRLRLGRGGRGLRRGGRLRVGPGRVGGAAHRAAPRPSAPGARGQQQQGGRLDRGREHGLLHTFRQAEDVGRTAPAGTVPARAKGGRLDRRGRQPGRHPRAGRPLRGRRQHRRQGHAPPGQARLQELAGLRQPAPDRALLDAQAAGDSA